jgi:hypothetical protein
MLQQLVPLVPQLMRVFWGTGKRRVAKIVKSSGFDIITSGSALQFFR